jgi:hypothetical protein
VSEHEFVTAMLAAVGIEVVAISYITYRIFKVLDRLKVSVARPRWS